MTARRTAAAVVSGPPEDALLRSAAALRRMGARLTRYDADALTLEARARRFGLATVIRIAAQQEGEATRLEIESRMAERIPFDFGLNAANVSRFQQALATTEVPPLSRRD